MPRPLANATSSDEVRQLAPPLSAVTRAVVWNQALWTAGYSLTAGGFLTYFGRELGARGLMIALLLTIPELFASAGLSARWVIQRVGARKRVWIGCSLLARVVSLGIPLLAFPELRPKQFDPLWVMAGCLAVSQAFQAVAYMAYLSWMADLVPDDHWGRFFAKRNIARLSILLIVPVIGGYLRDWWRTEVSPEAALLAYVIAFAVGIALLLASMLPLLSLPNIPVRSVTFELPNWSVFTGVWKNRSLRWLMIHNWCLALANGLTQSAFFHYRYGPLSVSLGTYYVLENVMLLTMIPVSAITGHVCDRFGNRAMLFWGGIIASNGLLFWLLATPQQWWWLFGASICWGGFAAMNISGRNLLLKLSPRSDNAAHLSLFRLIGGLLAGLSGLAGGIVLDRLQQTGLQVDWGTYRFESYQLLFLLSWIGRMAAVLLILKIHEPRARSLRRILQIWRRWRSWKHRQNRRSEA